jgi:hypothetical protein
VATPAQAENKAVKANLIIVIAAFAAIAKEPYDSHLCVWVTSTRWKVARAQGVVHCSN